MVPHRTLQALAFGLLLAINHLSAQVAPTASTPPASAEKKKPAPAEKKNPGELITLNPFEVKSESDNSYGALNSNSLTQFNTELSKTPVSADIFTEEFMRDISATSIEEMLNGYGAGAGTVMSNPDSDALSQQPGDRVGNQTIGIRGTGGGAIHRDGFPPPAPPTISEPPPRGSRAHSMSSAPKSSAARRASSTEPAVRAAPSTPFPSAPTLAAATAPRPGASTNTAPSRVNSTTTSAPNAWRFAFLTWTTRSATAAFFSATRPRATTANWPSNWTGFARSSGCKASRRSTSASSTPIRKTSRSRTPRPIRVTISASAT